MFNRQENPTFNWFLLNPTIFDKIYLFTFDSCLREFKTVFCNYHTYISTNMWINFYDCIMFTCAVVCSWVRSGIDLKLEHNQSFCRERDYEIRQISLVCSGATATQYTYKHITSCECQREVWNLKRSAMSL